MEPRRPGVEPPRVQGPTTGTRQSSESEPGVARARPRCWRGGGGSGPSRALLAAGLGLRASGRQRRRCPGPALRRRAGACEPRRQPPCPVPAPPAHMHGPGDWF